MYSTKTMKVCKVCKQIKSENDFPIHSAGRLRSTCKECYNKTQEKFRIANVENLREKGKTYYKLNREKVISRTKLYGKLHPEVGRKSSKEFGERSRQKFIEFKKTLYCTVCGENDPACLDFHHLDKSQKDYSVSDLVRCSGKMKKELEKCIPICANCHRKLHYYENDKNIPNSKP